MIEAKLVAESVGLPAMWRTAGDPHTAFLDYTVDPTDEDHRTLLAGIDGEGEPVAWEEPHARLFLDLSDPQTAFGVALKLDEWERSRDPNWGLHGPTPLSTDSWTRTLARAMALNWQGVARDMVASLTSIAHDHAIRRALGWTVEPGTWAVLRLYSSGLWIMEADGKHCWWQDYAENLDESHRHAPSLAGITDRAEAFAVIYDELVGA